MEPLSSYKPLESADRNPQLVEAEQEEEQRRKYPGSRFRHVTWLKHTTVQAYLSHNSRSTCFIRLTYLPNGAGSMELQFGFVSLPTDHLLTEQDLHNGQASVRPSVCLLHRSTAATAASGFAAKRRRL